MITLKAYRAAVGTFYVKSNHIHLQNVSTNKPLFDNRNKDFAVSNDSSNRS